MPIDYRHYAHEWATVIRPAILRRAGARPELGIQASCELCGIDNRAMRLTQYPEGPRDIKIVLTVAHLDQDPNNNDPENLAALCQRCHLRHDRPFNLIKASITRDRTRKQALLPGINAAKWRNHMAKKKHCHSLNVMFDTDEMKMLTELASVTKTNMSIVLRQALQWRYRMQIQGIPVCAQGQACMVPHMHVPPTAPPNPPVPTPTAPIELVTATPAAPTEPVAPPPAAPTEPVAP